MWGSIKFTHWLIVVGILVNRFYSVWPQTTLLVNGGSPWWFRCQWVFYSSSSQATCWLQFSYRHWSPSHWVRSFRSLLERKKFWSRSLLVKLTGLYLMLHTGHHKGNYLQRPFIPPTAPNWEWINLIMQVCNWPVCRGFVGVRTITVNKEVC